MVVGTHAVPGCDAALSRVCNEWAAKEKVQLKLDIVDGFNLLMTVFSEGRGKSGHDIAGLAAGLRHLRPPISKPSMTSCNR